MIITLARARTVVAEFCGKSGKCAETDDVRLFVQEIVQRLLHRGAHGNMRKWSFCLTSACFTAPPDMEVPLKVKVDGFPEHVWSQWYEFFDVHTADTCDNSYLPGLYEEVNPYFSIYDLPAGGAKIAAIPLGTEAADASITVQGLDRSGNEVFTIQDGVSIHGEKIPINRALPLFSRTTFTKITGIEKTRTTNYVRLYWQKHDSGGGLLSRGLLGEYRPTDVNPVFRRFRVPAARADCCVKVTVLGRVRELDYYHENDIIPITSIGALKKMAQLIQAERNDNIQVAAFHSSAVGNIIDDENQYYRTGQEPFDYFKDTSPGNNENLM